MKRARVCAHLEIKRLKKVKMFTKKVSFCARFKTKRLKKVKMFTKKVPFCAGFGTKRFKNRSKTPAICPKMTSLFVRQGIAAWFRSVWQFNDVVNEAN